jgi:hypothetical protein
MNITRHLGRLALPVILAVAALGTATTSPVSANPPTDAILLSAINIDFGGPCGLAPPPGNFPLCIGWLEWDTSGGTVTPHLTGELYLNNALGLHARMQMRYFDVFGNVLATKVGGEVWASDNATHSWSVDLDPYSNPAIYRVDVSTTYKLGVNWYTKSLQTVYI